MVSFSFDENSTWVMNFLEFGYYIQAIGVNNGGTSTLQRLFMCATRVSNERIP